MYKKIIIKTNKNAGLLVTCDKLLCSGGNIYIFRNLIQQYYCYGTAM